MPEQKVKVELSLMEIAEVASLAVALAVDDVRGFQFDRDSFSEQITENPMLVADLLFHAAKEIGRARMQIAAWCDANHTAAVEKGTPPAGVRAVEGNEPGFGDDDIPF